MQLYVIDQKQFARLYTTRSVSKFSIIHFKHMISFYNVQTVKQAEEPCPRWGQAMVSIHNHIFLFGGYENSKYYNDLWRFSLQALRFERIEQKGDVPPPCSNFTLNYHPTSNCLLLFGGGTLNKEKLNSVYKLKLSSFTWEKLSFPESATLPWQRSYHCAEIVRDYLLICGGEFFHDLEDTWILNLNTNEWKQVKGRAGSMKPKARKFASSFVYKNKVYIVGGCSGKYECLDESVCMDFSQFLVDGDQKLLEWKQVQFVGRELMMRWGHISIVKGSKAYIFGGRHKSQDLQNLIQVDLNTNKCISMAIKGESPKGRRRPGMCIRNNTLFCFSGFDGSYINDFIYFNLPLSLNEAKVAQDTEGKQCLQKYLAANNVQEQFINFEDDVLYVHEYQFKQIQTFLCCYKTQQDTYFEDANYLISSNKLAKSPFFTYFNSTYSREQFSFYTPANIDQHQRLFLMKMFLTYLQFSKVILPFTKFTNSKTYFKHLLQIAQYYCCSELQQICKKELLKFFTDEILSHKPNLDNMFQIGEILCSVGKDYQRYAGYYIVNKLVGKHRSSIRRVDDLKAITSSYKNKLWIEQMITLYSFEVSQAIGRKEENELENISNVNVQHKGEIHLEKTRKGSLHNSSPLA